MANICTGQHQIYIILPWIVRTITKVLKKAIKCLGNSIFFLCCHTVYIGLQDIWPLCEHSPKHKSHFSVLTQLEINKKYLPKYFTIKIQYKFGEKEHLRHFFHIFSKLHFRYRKNAAEEDSTHKFPNLGFQA